MKNDELVRLLCQHPPDCEIVIDGSITVSGATLVEGARSPTDTARDNLLIAMGRTLTQGIANLPGSSGRYFVRHAKEAADEFERVLQESP